jgi:hypothetical protein
MVPRPHKWHLPNQETDNDIERRRTRQPGQRRPVQPPKATKRDNVTPNKGRVAPGKPRSGKKAASAERPPKSQKAAKQAKPSFGAREGGKAAKVLDLLRRPDGASLKDLMNRLVGAFVRGFLSRAVATRMGLKRVSAKSDDGECRYSVAR